MSTDGLIVLVGVVVFAVMFVVVIASKLSGTILNPFRNVNLQKTFKRLLGIDSGSSLLMSTLTKNKMLVANTTTIHGHNYSLYTDDTGNALIVAPLDYQTTIHVLAIGAQSGLPQNQIKNKTISRVELEGDFNEKISLYCTPGKELELLQLFDPVTMQYFASFCEGHSFEIKDGCLTVLQKRTSQETDTSTMFEDLQNFLEKNNQLLARL